MGSWLRVEDHKKMSDTFPIGKTFGTPTVDRTPASDCANTSDSGHSAPIGLEKENIDPFLSSPSFSRSLPTVTESFAYAPGTGVMVPKALSLDLAGVCGFTSANLGGLKGTNLGGRSVVICGHLSG